MDYVVGFLYQNDHVLLIEKRRPSWQAGKLNGIGGKIEIGESPHAAMVREAEEEAGVTVSWDRFAEMVCGHDRVHFYRYRSLAGVKPQTKTDEIVRWVPLPLGEDVKVITNLRWLVPMGFFYCGKVAYVWDSH